VFFLRPAQRSDLSALLELAGFLNSLNLPAEEGFLLGRLERSARSFATPEPPSEDREYQFVLEDVGGQVIGTCAILSKHGTPTMPHFYLEVGEEQRYAESIGVLARHVTLRLGRSTDGPTEIGSLVLHPDARGRPGSPGKLLSWGRFAFIASHRECFESELIAEMRAALDPRGRNLFWEAVGKRFTGLSYEEADHRSAVDKSFIRDLFPEATLYATLLEPDVVAKLGHVHEETGAAVRLLERAGFRWNGQIDPFDAGPYYGSRTDRVIPIRETVQAIVGAEEPGADATDRIVSSGSGATFRAITTPVEEENGVVSLPKDARRRLTIREGETVAVTPLPVRPKDDGG
jgi:arginine N-succinyltransferase